MVAHTALLQVHGTKKPWPLFSPVSIFDLLSSLIFPCSLISDTLRVFSSPASVHTYNHGKKKKLKHVNKSWSLTSINCCGSCVGSAPLALSVTSNTLFTWCPPCPGATFTLHQKGVGLAVLYTEFCQGQVGVRKKIGDRSSIVSVRLRNGNDTRGPLRPPPQINNYRGGARTQDTPLLTHTFVASA